MPAKSKIQDPNPQGKVRSDHCCQERTRRCCGFSKHRGIERYRHFAARRASQACCDSYGRCERCGSPQNGGDHSGTTWIHQSACECRRDRRPFGPTWETDSDEWWRNVEVNLKGPMLCCKAVVTDIIARRNGRIINVASGEGDPHGNGTR